VNFNATVVIAEGMRKAGFKVDIVPMDWGTVSQRRNNKGPVDLQKSNSGGWNLFVTVATAFDAGTPLTNPYLATPCPNDVAGFPCDEELQRLRRSSPMLFVACVCWKSYPAVPMMNAAVDPRPRQ
jgi:peptide/nickel transport system substrate-binding protein